MAKQEYLAFLRGINVGGHHKVPMAELRALLQKQGFTEVKTVLNSGNVRFRAPAGSPAELESALARELEAAFGFSVPVMLRSREEGEALLAHPAATAPEAIKVLLSFLRKAPENAPSLPWKAPVGGLVIQALEHNTLITHLGQMGTPDLMKILEAQFGRDITTRTARTLERLLSA